MALADAVAWHDLECGGYTADLPLWLELAGDAGGPVLDVGAGTGRVALALARAGHEVVALDRDPQLLNALEARAGGLPVTTVEADARKLDLGRRFPLIVVPMQTIQLLGGARGRAAFLVRAAAHLEPGSLLAVAIAEELEPYASGDPLPTPDVAERDGVVLWSQAIRLVEGEGGWLIERARQVIAPDGTTREANDRLVLDKVGAPELEDEAAAAGLDPAGRRTVAPTHDHVGSTVVLLRHA